MKNPLGNVEGNTLLLLITIASSSGFILYGYDNGVFAGINVSPWYLSTFATSASILGTISAIFNAGAALGALVSFVIGDRLGRKKSILLGSLLALVGACIQGSATVIAQLLVGRIICGVGVGILTSTVGVWQAEVTPAHTRGRFLALQLCLGGSGFFLSTWIAYGLHTYAGRFTVIFPLLFQLIFIVITGTLTLFLPESPRWLVKKKRYEEALAILRRLQMKKQTSSVVDAAQQELENIKFVDELEGNNEGRFGGFFTGGATQNFRRICMGALVMMFSQLNGINSVAFYLPTLVTQFIGATRAESLWVSGLSALFVVVFATIPVMFVDKLGRRVFLWFSALLQGICFAIVAALLATAPAAGNPSFGIAIVSFIFIFQAVNSASWFGTVWVYSAELMPLHLREKGMGLAVIFYWLFDFMLVEITPVALNNIGYKFYIILACFNGAIAVTVYFVFPETARKSLEEVDYYFAETYGGEKGREELGALEMKPAVKRNEATESVA